MSDSSTASAPVATGVPVATGGPVAPVALAGAVAAGLVFFASAAILVLEIVSMRLVAPYVGLTLETSSAVIGVSLAAIAVGAWVGGRLADSVDPRALIGPVLGLAGVSTLLILPVVHVVGDQVAGGSTSAVLILISSAILLPAGLLSAVSPLVVKLQLASLRETGATVGRYSSLGTLGAIVATFATGFVLLATLSTSAIVVWVGIVVTVVGVVASATLAGSTSSVALVAPVAPVGITALAVLSGGVATVTAVPCQVQTTYHCANVEIATGRSATGSTGRLLVLDRGYHSFVDLADPTYLRFAYTQAFGAVADSIIPASAPASTPASAPASAPVSALHIGGGGGTIPRYVAATRPGSKNRILEIDGGVLDIARSSLGLQLDADMTATVGDARVGLRDETPGTRDLVFGDAFSGLTVPWHLATREVAEEIRTVLTPQGVYVMNVIDRPPADFLAAELATLREVFPHVGMIADPATLAGRVGGNIVVLASAAPLPLAAITTALTRHEASFVLGTPDDADRATKGATPLTDSYAPVDQLLTLD